MVDKEIYENNDARLEVHFYGEDIRYWIQVGVAGLFITPAQFGDLYELLDAYMEEFDGK